MKFLAKTLVRSETREINEFFDAFADEWNYHHQHSYHCDYAIADTCQSMSARALELFKKFGEFAAAEQARRKEDSEGLKNLRNDIREKQEELRKLEEEIERLREEKEGA